VGCGTGAFTIGAARRGYRCLGISFDERNQRVARERALMSDQPGATFVIGDVRKLDVIDGVRGPYDVVICLECIEHILDDLRLFREMADRLNPGGRLLLTTPNYYYQPISHSDRGPFSKVEDGWHVRRGYTPAMLEELCRQAGLVSGEITDCSGFVSQKVTSVWRSLGRVLRSPGIHWVVTLPLRGLPILLVDDLLTHAIGWPFFSICLEAYKPRFAPPSPTKA
jgi:2-polyprenyl-3-methyl-5-hydroxy-6-metoxy-1,4-benzoquinol methylase